jgi:hypothetical protein
MLAAQVSLQILKNMHFLLTYQPERLYKSSFFTSAPDSRTANKNWLNFKQALETAVKKNVPSKLSKGGVKRPHGLMPPFVATSGSETN